MGLSVQTKSLQEGFLLAVSSMAMDVQPQARSCRPKRSLCRLRAWASPLPAAVGVQPGTPQYSVPLTSHESGRMSEPRKMGPVRRAETQTAPPHNKVKDEREKDLPTTHSNSVATTSACFQLTSSKSVPFLITVFSASLGCSLLPPSTYLSWEVYENVSMMQIHQMISWFKLGLLAKL